MGKKLKLRDFNKDNPGKIQVLDVVTLPTASSRVITTEGYLQAKAALTMVGVQCYPARDFGIDSDEMVGVFRPAATVFHPETISSIKMKPIVELHPGIDVDSSNHTRFAIGTVGEQVEAMDDKHLGASIQINDKPSVDKVISGEIDELSLGYDVYILSEEGDFEGEKYVYKMDGPMINNHLAIVPEGRCGDSCKILDTGGNNPMKKKYLVKLLTNSGVSAKDAKAFMTKSNDDEVASKGDMAEFAKLLKNRDIDFEALIPAVVEQLMPDLQAVVKSPEFVTAFATAAATAIGGTAPAEPGADAEEEEDPLTKEQQDAKIQDGINSRMRIVDVVTPFIKHLDDFDLAESTDREAIEAALKVVGYKAKDMKKLSDDHLLGILSAVSKDRADASIFVDGKFVDKSQASKSGISKPLTGLALKKMMDEKKKSRK